VQGVLANRQLRSAEHQPAFDVIRILFQAPGQTPHHGRLLSRLGGLGSIPIRPLAVQQHARHHDGNRHHDGDTTLGPLARKRPNESGNARRQKYDRSDPE